MNDEEPKSLSKNAQKKLLKRQRWEENKEKMQKQRREKKKLQKSLRKEKIEQGLLIKKPRVRTIDKEKIKNITVVIDCAFNDLMTTKEITSLCKQVARLYGVNRRSESVMSVEMTSFNGTLKAEFERAYPGYVSWRQFITREDEFVNHHTDMESIVYLSADADEDLEIVEEGKVYIIGGIVDKNRHKKICEEKARSLGIKTAKLPISAFLKLEQRPVLAVNHVFEILSSFLESKDWEAAFRRAIPSRKIQEDDEEVNK